MPIEQAIFFVIAISIFLVLMMIFIIFITKSSKE